MNYTTTEFTVTEQHIRLLRHANVCWLHIEFGAPGIDPKRPYGNSFVVGDVAEILGIELTEDENEEFNQNTVDRLTAIHRETELALQIILATGTFTPGTYVREEWTTDWRLVA